jgi:cell division protein YceG involved in septum cleavage
VLYNRLDKGMKLSLDSTVIYAENLKTNTTSKQDRKSKSKYNTYRYKGLPPGPISAPGKAAWRRRPSREGQVALFRHGELRYRRDEIRRQPG